MISTSQNMAKDDLNGDIEGQFTPYGQRDDLQPLAYLYERTEGSGGNARPFERREYSRLWLCTQPIAINRVLDLLVFPAIR